MWQMIVSPPSQDDNFFLDCHSAVTQCMASSNQSIRAQASWALANLADSFSSRPHLLTPHLTLSLGSSILLGLRDVDKVRCNAVRAAGNLLRLVRETGKGLALKLRDRMCGNRLFMLLELPVKSPPPPTHTHTQWL